MTNFASQVKGTIAKMKMPELVGSEKQIKWAESIRRDAFKVMMDEVKSESYDGGKEKRPVGKLGHALMSKEGISAEFEEMRNLPASRKESTVNSMNAFIDRFNRCKEVMMNEQASFWIENRSNTIENHLFKSFTKYVETGVKNF
ncbi:hypothetical protein BTS2_3333 [Bacillus sp. TS-2]|nr:hypothetical protein BTS2_3333 [Bacillus sp. TS-2]